MRTVSITLAILLMISIAIPAMAHHSAAAQDFTKRVEMQGVVKSWQNREPAWKTRRSSQRCERNPGD